MYKAITVLAYVPYSNFITKAVANLILKKKLNQLSELIELRNLVLSNNNKI